MMPYIRHLLFVLLLAPVVARATTFTVDSTLDAVDATPGDGSCATGGPMPVRTLRAAVQEANAHPGDDSIVIPAGTFTLAISGQGEDHAVTGDLDINDGSNGNLTITGAGAASTIIDGGGLDRVFDLFTNATIS